MGVLVGAPVNERLLIIGTGRVTVKLTPVLACPLTVTTTFPVAAPAGTGTAMEFELQLVGVASVPLNVTVLSSWVGPKLFPEIVTGVPTGPLVGERLTPGADQVTIKGIPLLTILLAVTTTLPLDAFDGTVTTIEPAPHVAMPPTAPL